MKTTLDMNARIRAGRTIQQGTVPYAPSPDVAKLNADIRKRWKRPQPVPGTFLPPVKEKAK